jgi:hypothetical protein
MPGIFSRLKTWVAGEVLTHSDLNAEFDNLIANGQADKLDGVSHNLSEMQSSEDPAPSGTPDVVQPISISDEIKRIRYAINRIVGKTNWYEAPARSLENFFAKPLHLFAPKTFIESSAAQDVVFAGIQDSLSFADTGFFDSSIKKFSAASLKSPVTAPRFFLLDPGRMNPNYGTFSLWFRNVTGLETILYNHSLGVRVYLNNAGYIAVDLNLATPASSTEKTVQTVILGSEPLAGLTSFSHLLFSFKIENKSTDSISLFINGQQVGSTVTGPFNINSPNRAEHWVVNGSSTSRTVTSTLTNNALPGSSGWTKVTTGGTESILNGVLTVDTASASQLYYTNTPPSTSSDGQWFEFKLRLNESTSPTVPWAVPSADKSPDKFGVILRTSTDQKICDIAISPNGIQIRQISQLGLTRLSVAYPLFIPHDFHQWTVVTVQTVSSTHVNVYINGVFRGSAKLGSDSTAGSLIAFGDMGDENQNGSFDLEYFKLGTSGTVIAPNITSTINYSDFCVVDSESLDSTTIQALQLSSPVDIFGNQESYGVSICSSSESVGTRKTAGFPFPVSTGFSLLGGPIEDSPVAYVSGFFSDGKTPTNISARIKIHSEIPNTQKLDFFCFMTVIPKSYTSYGTYTAFGKPRVDVGNLTYSGVPFDSVFFEQYSGALIIKVDDVLLKYSAVFPAGYCVVNIYYANFSSATTKVWLYRMMVETSKG